MLEEGATASISSARSPDSATVSPPGHGSSLARGRHLMQAPLPASPSLNGLATLPSAM